MKKNLVNMGLMVLGGLLAAAVELTAADPAVTINGAGASFPFPIYSDWAFKYEKVSGMKLNYQSIGSGGGIKQIKEKTVDFGASDAPLKADELKAAGLVQFPMIIGGAVPVVNIKGVAAGQLRLTGKVLAEIYLGAITKWNDDAIKALNPELRLPDTAIAVVYRSDGSGTTWLYTNYLSKASASWAVKVGNDKSVAWPTGVGAKGNEGVAAIVKNTDGGIGYVEYAYAVENNLAWTQMQNRAGAFVKPTVATFAAAAASADWKGAPGFYMVLTNQPGAESWPITGASFILIHKDQKTAGTARAMFKFFDWCYKNGADAATKLNYVPIPESVYTMVEETWKNDVKADGATVWP